MDTYWITAQRFSPVMEERSSVGPDGVQSTAHLGKAVASRWVKGDRYYDWKKGDGKAQAKELLAWARPTAELQVTLVRVKTNGSVAVGQIRRWRKDHR